MCVCVCVCVKSRQVLPNPQMFFLFFFVVGNHGQFAFRHTHLFEILVGRLFTHFLGWHSFKPKQSRMVQIAGLFTLPETIT